MTDATDPFDYDYQRIIHEWARSGRRQAPLATPITVTDCPDGLSVTQRIRHVIQPDKGLLPLSLFQADPLYDDRRINGDWSIPAAQVGLAIDHLGRVMAGSDPQVAFYTSMQGAIRSGAGDQAEKLLRLVEENGKQTITAACRLVFFDDAFRGGEPVDPAAALGATVSWHTLQDLAAMLMRLGTFLASFGPVTWDGFTFEGGYTSKISFGDGDLLTHDTLWDLKVSAWPPTPSHTLQLAVYYLMGLHSTHQAYRAIRRLGIYNPRLNTAWTIATSRIDPHLALGIERDIIGYQDAM